MWPRRRRPSIGTSPVVPRGPAACFIAMGCCGMIRRDLEAVLGRCPSCFRPIRFGVPCRTRSLSPLCAATQGSAGGYADAGLAQLGLRLRRWPVWKQAMAAIAAIVGLVSTLQIPSGLLPPETGMSLYWAHRVVMKAGAGPQRRGRSTFLNDTGRDRQWGYDHPSGRPGNAHRRIGGRRHAGDALADRSRARLFQHW